MIVLDLLDQWQQTERAKRSGQAMLVIFRSDDGQSGWTPVKPEDVPEWVKSPTTIGRIMDGEMVSDGTGWFVAAGNHVPNEGASQPESGIATATVRPATSSEAAKYAH